MYGHTNFLINNLLYVIELTITFYYNTLDYKRLLGMVMFTRILFEFLFLSF